jgi:hypothetical protein
MRTQTLLIIEKRGTDLIEVGRLYGIVAGTAISACCKTALRCETLHDADLLFSSHSDLDPWDHKELQFYQQGQQSDHNRSRGQRFE